MADLRTAFISSTAVLIASCSLIADFDGIADEAPNGSGGSAAIDGSSGTGAKPSGGTGGSAGTAGIGGGAGTAGGGGAGGDASVGDCLDDFECPCGYFCNGTKCEISDCGDLPCPTGATCVCRSDGFFQVENAPFRVRPLSAATNGATVKIRNLFVKNSPDQVLYVSHCTDDGDGSFFYWSNIIVSCVRGQQPAASSSSNVITFDGCDSGLTDLRIHDVEIEPTAGTNPQVGFKSPAYSRVHISKFVQGTLGTVSIGPSVAHLIIDESTNMKVYPQGVACAEVCASPGISGFPGGIPKFNDLGPGPCPTLGTNCP